MTFFEHLKVPDKIFVKKVKYGILEFQVCSKFTFEQIILYQLYTGLSGHVNFVKNVKMRKIACKIIAFRFPQNLHDGGHVVKNYNFERHVIGQI